MDEHNVNEQIQAGLALFANKQRELEALAAHVEQEKAQVLALKQQTPMSYPMVNPYLAMSQQQLPYASPAIAQQQVTPEMEAPVESQPPAVAPPMSHPQHPAPSSSSTSSLEADVHMLARGLDQHAENFNAALESVMSTLNDITRRLVLLEGGQSSPPTFDEVFEATSSTQSPVIEPAPQVVVCEPAPTPPPGVDTVALAERVDLLSIHVHKLTKLVDSVLEQQRRTNDLQRDLLEFLGAQFNYDAKERAKPAVVLETPYVASTTADVVNDGAPSTPTSSKKSKKHKRKKKKR